MTILTRNPINTSLLQSTKFRLTFERLPTMTFFCQTANFPGLSLTEIPRSTPFVDLYVPGEKLIYDTLNITFLVDEDMRSWIEVHNWMRALTFPTEFEEYVNLNKQSVGSNIRAQFQDKPQYSDAALTFYTNQNNANIRIKFIDVFPTSLSTIIVSTGDTAENIITADATFRFSYYNFDKLKV